MAIAQIEKVQPGLGVIIPAAGASSRMGQPKLLLPWGDTTVIGQLIRQWRTLGVDHIGIVCRPGDWKLHAELDLLNFPAGDRIPNPQPELGMFSSIQCAMKWDGWTRGTTVWAVVLGDQPHLRLETLRTLLAFQQEHPDKICQPAYQGHPGHPVLLPAWAVAELKMMTEGTLKDFLKLSSRRCVQCSVEDSGLRLDMDTPEDYKQIQIHTNGT